MNTLFSLIWKIEEETSGTSMSPFKSCVLDTGSEKYDFNSVFRLVDAYGGQEAETVLCGDQNAFVLGTVDACRIAFGGNFQLVIFRLFGYLADAEYVSGRMICLGDLNLIAFVLFAPGCEHFLYFLFFHYIAETYFTRYGHLVGLGGCNGYRIGMNTKVSFLHVEGRS